MLGIAVTNPLLEADTPAGIVRMACTALPYCSKKEVIIILSISYGT
jgi:hypothetical protein